jgi:phosphoglycerate kinase
MIRYLSELSLDDLKGKSVLLRLDLNVPILNGEVIDSHRLDRVIDTIDYLREKEAKTIIVSHCAGKESETLLPMWHYLNGFFKVEFCKTYFTPEAVDKLLKLKNKDVLLFENIRVNPGEMANDDDFSKKLSQMADIFIDDAFAEMHREYSSIVGVPKYLPHFAGLLVKDEITHLQKVFNPAHPFIFVLGGAKFDTKLPLIKKYLEKADHVFVGGAIANDIFKAKGYEVGTSLLSEIDFGMEDIINNPKLVIPIDVTIKLPDGSSKVKLPNEVLLDEYIADVGPETIKMLDELVSKAKTVVWNGPLGKYKKGFRDMSEDFAEILAKATKENGLESIIGGGDTIASINMKKLDAGFSFISTGGGAMLYYLINENLPGLKALDN